MQLTWVFSSSGSAFSGLGRLSRHKPVTISVTKVNISGTGAQVVPERAGLVKGIVLSGFAV